MSHPTLFYAAVLLLGVFLSSVSQVLLKKAAQRRYPNKIAEYLNPLVVIAYGIFVGTTLLSVYAYKGIPLSMGPILEATGYIYVTVFGVTVFKEKLSKRKFAALFLILCGIAVYALIG